MAIAGANETFKKLSSQIESQFPGFIREEGPQFVSFLKAYFEYMEQNGKVVNATRSLSDYRDIDRTLDSFVEYFRRELMPSIPKDALVDQRLLIKNIRDFYKSRGTPESYRFLFRALFNKEVDFYYPGDDILRASDGRWLRESKLRVGEPKNINPSGFEGIKVTGAVSGATAVVQGVVSTISSGMIIYDMTVENIDGTFVDGERVFDDNNNYATVTAQIGPVTQFTITEGGSRHNTGDLIEIGGAGSTSTATAIVTRVKEATGITARIVKGGSGYTKNNTRVRVDGDGTGAEIVVASYYPEAIPTPLNTDLISSMKNVRLDSDFFVRKGANTAAITKKLTGILKAKTSTNTVYGIGSAFTSQLAVGDIVRITGSSTALRVHSIGGAQTFVSTAITNVNARANGYSKLAAANVSSTLASALTYSSTNFYMINAISIINPGKNYTTIPTITIIDDEVTKLNVDDGYGGFLGRNAVAVADTITGEIAELNILTRGSNFNKYSAAYMLNTTQGNSSFTTSYAGLSSSGAAATKYTIQKKTYSGEGLAQPTGVTNYPGKYIDTKGFLSWNNKLQDNFYYQEFSYVIRVTELLEKYRDVVRKLVHPSGTKLFADYQINATVNTPAVTTLSQSSIFALSLSEGVSIIDTVVGARVTSGILGPETISLTESMLGYVTKNVAYEDSFNVTDSLNSTNKAVATTTTESIDTTEIVNGTYVSVNLSSGTESITLTNTNDATYVSSLNTGTQSITATDSVAGIYTSGQLDTGAQSITATDTIVGNGITSAANDESITSEDSIVGTNRAIASFAESITSTDSIVGNNSIPTIITETITTADSIIGYGITSAVNDESITSTDSIVGGVVTSATTGTESVTSTDSTGALVTLGASVSETITSTDSVVGANITSGSITENNGEITSYASVQISVYQSTQISEFVTPVLNLDDTVYVGNSVAGSLSFPGGVAGTRMLDLDTGFTLNDSSYTIEGWIRLPDFTNAYSILGAITGDTSVGPINLFVSNSTTFTTDSNGGLGQKSYTVPAMSANTWYHFALVRSGTTETLFLNGTRSSTGTLTNSINYTGATKRIGASYLRSWPGYMTNLRVVVGTAVYNPTATTITVPNFVPLPNITNTKYLMLGDSPTTDASGVNIVTNTGSVTQSSSIKPF